MSESALLEAEEEGEAQDNRDLILFKVGGLLCAMDILQAQEINRHLTITEVPETAEYVRGVANLRGQVITVIDLRVVFDLARRGEEAKNQVVVVYSDGDAVGLLVDAVVDIVSVEEAALAQPPANVSGVKGEFFDSVYKRDEDIAGVINLSRVLQPPEAA